MAKIFNFNKLSKTQKVLIVVALIFLAIVLLFLFNYLNVSNQARYTNTFGRETVAENLQDSEIIDDNFPLFNSKITLILKDDQKRPYAYQSHTLKRIVPFYDESIREMRYWETVDIKAAFFSQEIKTMDAAKKYIDSNTLPQEEKAERDLRDPSQCTGDYYDVCNPDQRFAKLEDFIGLKQGMTSNEAWKFLEFASNRMTSGGEGPSNGLPTRDYALSDEGLNFLVAGFDLDPFHNSDTAKLQKIYIIKDDRSFIEVPTKADGTFDFDGVLKEIEKQ